MCGRRTSSIEIGAEVCISRRNETGGCKCLRIQPETGRHRIILACGQRAGDYLRLVVIPPASLVLVRIILPGRLPCEGIGIVKDLSQVCGDDFLFERRSCGSHLGQLEIRFRQLDSGWSTMSAISRIQS